MVKIFIIVFFMISTNILYCYEFNGIVKDANTDIPLNGVTVRIEMTGFGTITNKGGLFSIKNIPAGDYNAVFSIIG